MFPFDGLRYHYARWRSLRDAEAGLPRPDDRERASIERFRDGVRGMPVNGLDGRTPTEGDWAEAMNRLRHLALTADPRAFLRWDVIAARMAPTSSPATAAELSALRAHPDWQARWSEAVRDVSAGRPVPYVELPGSSETLIQTVHHVMQLERLSGRQVQDWKAIVEFGGGFGGLCRVVHALGFRGRYLIYDLPQMVLLQRYYLDEVADGAGDAGLATALRGVLLTSDFDTLAQFVALRAPDGHALFVATWSLSEAPRALRDRIKPLAQQFGHDFIGYQGRYGEVDNVEYFAHAWLRGVRHTERIMHRADDYYSVGRPGT